MLKVTDPVASADYQFPLVKTETGFGFTLETVPWEPSDPMVRWRIPLHPWIGGMHVDRLHGTPKSYMRGPADGRFPGTLLFPPLVTSLTNANISTPVKMISWNSRIYIIGGRYIFYYDPSNNTITQEEDLGSGVSAVDAAVFNNELVIACGASTKIFTLTTGSTLTQATDNTFAIALGVVGSQLWRAHDTNQMSSCTTAPRTLSSWTPADPNEYTVGDTTWPITTITDYGGIPWIGKGDGLYAPDPQARFKNQIPALAKTPHADNTKGAWTAQGSLFVPSSSGLFRVRLGKAKKVGPEVTNRPSYRWWVRGGVEYGDWMYLLCTDEASAGKTCIVAMSPSDLNTDHGMEYVYHHWADLDSTDKGYAIAVSTAGTNPQLLCGYGTTGVRWIKLGRGGGRDPDDSDYAFGATMTLETGPMMPANDITMLSTLVGVDVACDFSRSSENESLTISYRYDSLTDGGAYTNLLSTAEGGGTAAITTTGFTKATRYAAANVQGRYLEIKFTGASDSTLGNARPVIREAWAFGYSHPETTDVINVAIDASRGAMVNGKKTGNGHAKTVQLFRDWMHDGTELTVVLPDYEIGRTTRFLVRKVEEHNASATPGNASGYSQGARINIALARVDRAGTIGESV